MTDAWTDKLSDYLDDELSAAERQAVEAHLATCPTCARVLAELGRLAARTRGLPDVPPRADLWPGIAQRITAAPRVRRPVPMVRRRILLSVPQLAAAAALLVAVGAGAMWQVMPTTPSADPLLDLPVSAVRPVGTTYDAAVVRLETMLRDGRDRLDPRTVRVLEESLVTIDRAIFRAETALAADPTDAYLRQHLAETMQRKLDLLGRAAALTVSS